MTIWLYGDKKVCGGMAILLHSSLIEYYRNLLSPQHYQLQSALEFEKLMGRQRSNQMPHLNKTAQTQSLEMA